MRTFEPLIGSPQQTFAIWCRRSLKTQYCTQGSSYEDPNDLDAEGVGIINFRRVPQVWTQARSDYGYYEPRGVTPNWRREPLPIAKPRSPFHARTRWRRRQKRVRLRRRRYKRRCFKRRHRRRAFKCDVQSGIEVAIIDNTYERESSVTKMLGDFRNSLLKLIKFANVRLDAQLLEEIEAAAALVIALSGCNDYSSAIAAIVLYLKRYTNQSMLVQILHYIESSLGMETQSSDIGWVQALRNMHTSWSKIRKGKFVHHISRMMGILVSVGLCKHSQLVFRINNFVVFEPALLRLHVNSADFVEAVSNTVIFFVERIALAWQEQSFTALFEDDREARSLDDDYQKCITWWALVENGNLEKIAGKTDNEFNLLLNDTTERLKKVKENCSPIERKFIEDKILRLCNMMNDFTTMKVSGSIREAPFAIEIFGKSNQGKSSVLEQIIAALLTSANLPTSKEYQRTINASDQYLSNYTTNVMVAIMDDFANDSEKFTQKSPTRSIIDFCNNAIAYGNAAEISGKGKKFLEPKIVAVTTNVKNLKAGVFSNCPYSIQRRMHAVITVEARPEFQLTINGKPSGLDSSKVAEYYKDKEPPALEDLWTLTVERAVEPEKITHVAGYAPVEWQPPGCDTPIKLERVGIKEVVNYLISAFTAHRENQKAILERSRKAETCIETCGYDMGSGKTCNQICGYCMLHPNYKKETQRAIKQEDEIMETHIGLELTRGLETAWTIVSNRVTRDLLGFSQTTETVAAAAAVSSARSFAERWDWIKMLPSGVVGSPVFVRFIMKCKPATVRKVVRRSRALVWAAMAGIVGLTYKYDTDGHPTAMAGSICAAAGTLFHLSAEEVLHRVARRYLVWRNRITCNPRTNFVRNTSVLCAGLAAIYAAIGITDRFHRKDKAWVALTWTYVAVCIQRKLVNDTAMAYRTELVDMSVVAPTLTDFRERHVGKICKSFAIIGGIYTLAKVYKSWKRLAPQGSLEPMTHEEVLQRDNERSPWTPVVPHELPVNRESCTTTSAQLFRTVQKNLVYGSVHGTESTHMVNGLFLRSNVVLMPDHYFDRDNLDITFRKKNPDASGGKFVCRLSRTCSYRIPGTDMRVCYSATGGSFKDVTKYFGNELPDTIDFSLFWRMKEGEIMSAKGLATKRTVTTSHSSYPGYLYSSLTMDTFPGLCGATLVSNRVALIYGIHLGGKSGSPVGCAGYLTRMQLEEAYANLRCLEGTLLTGTAEHFETQVLGKNVVELNAPIDSRNVLRWMPHGSQIEYYGSAGNKTKFKTTVKNTLISESVTEIMDCPNVYRGPMVNPPWKGWQACLANMALPAHPYPHALLEMAIRDYKSSLVEVFNRPMWNDICPLTDRDNINGIPGKRFVDGIRMSTAIGYPLTGTKRNYIVENVYDGYVQREFVPEIMDEIDRCLQLYRQGQRAYTIAKACKKDEILAKDKCRIFFGNPIALSFLVRKYFLPPIRVIQMNPIVSECAVGVNSQGPEWQALYNYIIRHGTDRLIGGDYGQYDQKLPSQLLLAALRIIIDLSMQCGYTEEDRMVMEAMAGDLVYAMIAFDGNLIGLTEGSHISGNSLTVILNSICGSLNMRSYFYERHWPPSFEARTPFRDVVSLITYGDDNIGSVHPQVDDFTIKGASQFLKKYGQVYTMPDKESELADFLPEEDFEFLKRKSVYIPELDMHVGALIDASIFKSLHCYMRDKNTPLTEEAACAANMDSALNEWFLHGRETYNMRRKQLSEIAAKHNLSYLLLGLNRTFEERVVDWKAKYTDEVIDVLPEDVRDEILDIQSSGGLDEARCDLYKTHQAVCDLLLDRTKSPLASGYHTTLVSIVERWLFKGFGIGDASVFTLDSSSERVQPPACFESCTMSEILRLTEFFNRMYAWLHQQLPRTKPTESGGLTTLSTSAYPDDMQPSVFARPPIVYECHSGEPETETLEHGGETAENVQFSEGQDVYHEQIISYADTTRTLQEPAGAELNNFFSRPVKIYETQIPLGTVLSDVIDPWSVFWQNPRVSNRISNYKLLRCKLHVKININGNGFYHGRYIVAYRPYANSDDFKNVSGFGSLMQFSQMPYVFVNPTTATGGELTLPFFWHENQIDLKNQIDLGKLYLSTLNPLRCVSDSTTALDLVMFAWATDVEMAVLTTDEPFGLTAQSGLEIQAGSEVDKANQQGVISRASAHVSRWAGFLAKVPSLAPFMMATEAAASAIGDIAGIFGYSRPVVTRVPELYRERPHASLAVTDMPDTAEKLTLHSKQELSVDPRIAGVSEEDPLSILSIARRESYLTTFTWARSDPADTGLFSIRVDPMLFVANDNLRVYTPVALAALPFTYWTGSLKFRFQVVCSQYHKGKIRLVYEPGSSINATEYNTNYMKILDLADEQDLTIEIGVQQSKSLIQRAPIDRSQDNQYRNDTTLSSATHDNGRLLVYVMNGLSTPAGAASNDADVEVNVFVSAGDDFEVFVPNNDPSLFIYDPQMGLEPQMGMEMADAHHTDMQDMPSHSPVYVLGKSGVNHPHLSRVFVGEGCASLRTLLKRYNLWWRLPSNAKDIRYGTLSSFPFLRGPQVDAFYPGIAPDPDTNICNTVMLHYVRQLFLGWRGSIRYKMIPIGKQDRNNRLSVCLAEIANAANFSFKNEVTWIDDDVAASVIIADNFNQPQQPLIGMSGMAMEYNRLNGILEFEVPYFSDRRFEPGRPSSYTSNNLQSIGFKFRHEYGTNNTQQAVDFCVAAGEDFQVYFWGGCPVMRLELNVVNP